MKNLYKTLILSLTTALALQFADAQISVRLTARIAPPALPVYIQPVCPTDGYLWEPGYWNYDDSQADYYWVPGVWMAPPRPGLYWTPGYWAFEGGVYGFYTGYWGAHVGYYGGINYGFGYGGSGFAGGEWRNGAFRYNAVINTNAGNSRFAFNGEGGISARPSQQEQDAMHEEHIAPTADQLAHEHAALEDKSSFSKLNNGRPVAAAMDHVNGKAFNTHGGAAAATPEARQNAIAIRAQRNAERAGNANKTDAANAQETAAHAEKKQEHAEEKQERAEQKAEKKQQQRMMKQMAAPKQPKHSKEERKVPV